MTIRKYLAGLALLFAIPGVVLLAMGNGIAWAFFIIAGFLGIGALGGADKGYHDGNSNDLLAQQDEYHANPGYLGSLARDD